MRFLSPRYSADFRRSRLVSLYIVSRTPVWNIGHLLKLFLLQTLEHCKHCTLVLCTRIGSELGNRFCALGNFSALLQKSPLSSFLVFCNRIYVNCGMTSLHAVMYMYTVNSSNDILVPVKDATARYYADLFMNL